MLDMAELALEAVVQRAAGNRSVAGRLMRELEDTLGPREAAGLILAAEEEQRSARFAVAANQ